ncbi:aspartic proteinase-like protein 2 [Tanacetum coccineum]
MAQRRVNLGVPLALYDPKGSSSAKTVGCNDGFCKSTFDAPGKSDNCKVGMLCAYAVTYGDGSSTAGFFVNDIVRLAQVSGNRQTTSMWGNVTFGCGAKQSGELGSSEQALDGIVGFGQSKTSMLSQLASEKKVKKMFSHCLDGNKGGGIFAIGEVVEPKVNTTPILDDHTHYNIELKSIDVNGDDLKLPTSLFDFLKKKGAVVDSGTTLAYFPDEIMAAQPDKKPFVVEKVFKCYKYSGKYGSFTLYSYLVLSDRLVTYDMENQAIGWTDYDCSSSIKVKDRRGFPHPPEMV